MRATDWFDKNVRNIFGRTQCGPKAEPQGWGEHSASRTHTSSIYYKSAPALVAVFLYLEFSGLDESHRLVRQNYNNHSTGSQPIKVKLILRQKVRPGSFVIGSALGFSGCIHTNLPSRISTFQAVPCSPVSKASCILCARNSLSINKPISVFKRAERG